MDRATKNIKTIGLLALLFSALFTAMSQVFYAKQVQEVPPFLFTGVNFFSNGTLLFYFCT